MSLVVRHRAAPILSAEKSTTLRPAPVYPRTSDALPTVGLSALTTQSVPGIWPVRTRSAWTRVPGLAGATRPVS